MNWTCRYSVRNRKTDSGERRFAYNTAPEGPYAEYKTISSSKGHFREQLPVEYT